MQLLKQKILVVDDNRHVLSALRILLSRHFDEVVVLGTPNALVSTLQEYKADIVLLDMNFSAGINSGNEGLFWLGEIKKMRPELPVVLFTAYADIELAIEGLKRGASDFLVKPWDNTKLLDALRAAITMQEPHKHTPKDDEVFWGESAKMQELLKILKKVAATDANVLIVGENGTGKEVIARQIHQLSARSKSPMVSVDMGAVAESLFESELFGHVKGAFTDAKADREGKFEAANGGTLFLDEIGNLAPAMQAKLLAALQSRRITRVGSNVAMPVDIRLVTATNSDLRASGFREDLLYRINTITVEVPPLRQRREDVAPLAQFFLDRFAAKYDRSLALSDRAVDKLEGYRWPGNVRELQHAIEKAVILADGKQLEPSDFHFTNPLSDDAIALEATSLAEMERQLIAKTLEKHDHNLTAVATALGISRPTLYARMKKYNL